MPPHKPSSYKSIALKIIYALAILLFASGCGDCGTEVAGTSTSVGTGIGGIALLPSGGAAAGAKVTARGGSIEFKSGKPVSRLFDSTVTDAQGRFTLHGTPLQGTFFLEIAIGADALPGVYFGEFSGMGAGVGAGDSALGRLRMKTAGSISGKFNDTRTNPDSLTWIGILGTAHFTGVKSADLGGSPDFRLDGLFPGDYRLTLISGPMDTLTNAKVEPVRVNSGAVTDVGLLER
jgi:hypothetical protein